MDQAYTPKRGVDFDDYIGTLYFENIKGLSALHFSLVLYPPNDVFDDAFIGIRYSGHDINSGKLVQGIIYPARHYTIEDLTSCFIQEEGFGCLSKFIPKASISIDQVYIRVIYSLSGGKDVIKWVAFSDNGEIVQLHGERRYQNPEDCE